MPTSGVLVQAPADSGTITLSINDVQVEMGATLFLRAQADDEMIVSVVEGAALVEAAGETRPIVAGGEVAIPIDTNSIPHDIPGRTSPYDDQLLESLPIGELDRPIEIAPPLSAEAADILAKFEPYFESIALDDYDELLDYLAAHGGAAEAEVAAFLNGLGYNFGSAAGAENTAESQAPEQANANSAGTSVKPLDESAGAVIDPIQSEAGCGDGEFVILTDCMPAPDEKKDGNEVEPDEPEPCILSLSGNCGDGGDDDDPKTDDPKYDDGEGGDSEPEISLPDGGGDNKKSDEGGGGMDIGMGG